MNVKYYHDFIGADDVLNRFEILQSSSVTPKLIEASPDAFSVEYLDVKKLEPVQGSQATLKLISESNFQFIDLHTDNMQEYLVKFYRAGKLYWLGYLDSELYNENLTDNAPYPVEFSAADFNILDRQKFLNGGEKAYSDIASFVTQLKRCFDQLGIPFQKLYIGCSTVPEGISMTTSETALHVLYIQSANFYDEDNEPMSCREVVESILQPLGLMMVQRDASVYIYDLNTVKAGGVMKCYDFATLAYVGDTAVNVQLGDIGEIGTMSTNASLGFEEMINNVTITSSLYADKENVNINLEEDKLSEKIDISRPPIASFFYNKSEQIENLNGGYFAVYNNKYMAPYSEKEQIIGCYAKYQPTPSSVLPLFRINSKRYITKVEPTITSGDNSGDRYIDYPYLINIKVSVYASTSNQPLLIEGTEPKKSEVLKVYCNLYAMSDKGEISSYYDNTGDTAKWIPATSNTLIQGKCILFFCKEKVEGSMLNNWVINSSYVYVPERVTDIMLVTGHAKGAFMNPDVSGSLVFEITNKSEVGNLISGNILTGGVSMLLFDKISIDVISSNGESPSTDDYEFKSYINKNVESDYEEVTLKCISANEDKSPIGRANILKKIDNHYELQLSYTRSGQTDILERLLMCTIHSNFTTKNKAISIDIKMTDNPALRYVTYNDVLQSNGMYITGAILDFHNAKTTIKAVEFSADVDKLSNIPYE